MKGGKVLKTFVRDLIEYSCVSQCVPLDLDNFKQLSVDKEVYIPCQKPNMEQLSKVSVDLSITNTRIIKTPKGTSLEGVTLTGYKLIVQGDIKYRVQYVSLGPTQSVHSAHFTIPFADFIVLPENFTSSSIITTSAFLEDIFANKVSERCIYLNSIILISAEIC